TFRSCRQRLVGPTTAACPEVKGRGSSPKMPLAGAPAGVDAFPNQEARMRARKAAFVVMLAGRAAAPAPTGDLELGLGGLVGSPRGSFGRAVGTGGGLYVHGLYSTHDGVLGLRMDGNYFLYGSETLRVPYGPGLPRLNQEFVTDNWIADFMVGP